MGIVLLSMKNDEPCSEAHVVGPGVDGAKAEIERVFS